MNSIKEVCKLYERQRPAFIKYMGSKNKIMPFVLEGINYVYDGGAICDLFAGSASLSGAIGNQVEIHSNDIQNYSGILADVYLNCNTGVMFPSLATILEQAGNIASDVLSVNTLHYDYSNDLSLGAFNELEHAQQQLINVDFDHEYHLFLKYYAGTWWTAEQAVWIDAIRETAEHFPEKSIHSAIIACLMHAMAYASQGTGHYAQYRDANTESSMQDILIYRRRSIAKYFAKKYSELIDFAARSSVVALTHSITSMDYLDCLKNFKGGTVYADPPYCFVHYSRFYHAIETLVLYDYPNIQEMAGKMVKGRYRENRHQSPFCIQTQVVDAFRALFAGISASKSNLVLSYSNTGMIGIDEIRALLKQAMPDKKMELLLTDHRHMTLGRLADRHRDVTECLILAY